MSLNLDRSTWRRVKFSDAVTNVNERVDDPASAGVDRYVGLEHLDPGSMTVTRWGTPDQVEATKLRFQAGDVIFGRRRAYQKKVARADFEGICSAHAMVLRAKSEIIDPDFLPVFLSSDYFLDRAIQISVGSLSPTVNWKTLAVQEFDLPSLADQRRLADLLWALERQVVAVRMCALSAEDVEKALLETLWSRGFQFASLESLVSSALGGVWGEEPGAADLDASVIRGTDIGLDGTVDFIGAPRRGVTERELAKRRLQRGDVLLEKSGGSPDQPVGKCAVVTDPLCTAVASNFVLVLRVKVDLLSGPFLAALLQGMRITGRLKPFVGRTTGISNLRTKELLSSRVPCPGLDEQESFLERLATVRTVRERFVEAIYALHNLRTALLLEVFG